MLLVHQAGSVKVGEVVRYTLTYTPSSDRILPSPKQLHVKIRNTSAIPLRAAYLHGPYTLHVAAYSSTFNPYKKVEDPSREGIPQFEPNLKAGGSWHSSLIVPDDTRESGDREELDSNQDGSPKRITWIIEVASQILFSSSATVNYELLVGRDEKSLELGFASAASKGHGEPGRLQDFKDSSISSSKGDGPSRGVYSQAVNLLVEDTVALWTKPALHQWEGSGFDRRSGRSTSMFVGDEPNSRRKQRRLHLVILTHGLHSNTGADMLYLKESIDATAKQAREDMKRRKQFSDDSKLGTSKDGDTASEADDDEEVIVRGFPGNAVRTERGIKYLGKRLAKYILTLTYPDQPYLPPSKSMSKTFSSKSSKASSFSSKINLGNEKGNEKSTLPKNHTLPYTFSSISLIGHSLGGLVQTYAIAYIQKYSPNFFEQIQPVNFVALASPLLGLSNENPLYVKFALDFGLVGRTGRDLGLSWRAPNFARSGWTAMIGGFNPGKGDKKPNSEDPRSKPLLKILPTGPAHQVLKKFRNRTVYSNVVNDGIVPLRTSCLLFLDWRGLDKVENARRENGLISTMAQFGWNELTGTPAKSSSPHLHPSKTFGLDNSPQTEPSEEFSDDNPRQRNDDVPQPDSNTTQNDNKGNSAQMFDRVISKERRGIPHESESSDVNNEEIPSSRTNNRSNILGDFFNFLKPATSQPQPKRKNTQTMSKKTRNTFRRAQTLKLEKESDGDSSEFGDRSKEGPRPVATRGDSLNDDPNGMPPPKTSVFEAAGDILNPPIPSDSWLIDPSSRDRTIFHDRIYHPEDIPPPPAKRQRLTRTSSSSNVSMKSAGTDEKDYTTDGSGMKVEEKIARAYHNGLSWRKVLVRLEPDAHNNMIVRRMFANAYGWDVVKHLCDTHFADTYAAATKDTDEASVERAKAADKPVGADGEEVYGQSDYVESRGIKRTSMEQLEAADSISALTSPSAASYKGSMASNKVKRKASHNDSVTWTDSMFEESASDSESEEPTTLGPFEAFQRFWNGDASKAKSQKKKPSLKLESTRQNSNQTKPTAEIDDHLTESPTEASRGLGITRQSNTAEPFLEADAMEPLTSEDARPDTLAGKGEELPVTATSSPTMEMGLKKPPEANLSDMPGSPALTRNQVDSVVEQVARLSVAGGSLSKGRADEKK